MASITASQVWLDESLPFLELKASDEKKREGSLIPLRSDLAEELENWLTESDALHGPDPVRKLLVVPSGLVRILDRDLAVAKIPKVDDRGRSVDVHALRHTTGTLLSRGGVQPRTAQEVMRHGNLELTMRTYTVHGALDRLPELNLDYMPLVQEMNALLTLPVENA